MINVICLKYGNKYEAIYVNRLYNMIQRHLTTPHRFICFTEDTNGIDPRVEIRKIPTNLPFTGWWWKPYVFRKDHFPEGDTNLFIDLDMVIVKNIDKLIDYQPGKFVGLRDVGRVWNNNLKKLCSAVMRWPAGQYSDIWSDLERQPERSKAYQGDQDWVWNLHKNSISFFPDDWIRSYKWEVRDRSEMARVGGRYCFKTIRDVTLNPETAILAFHGTPDPHDIMDPIIVDNWR